MRPPLSDPATDAFLRLADLLDGEARIVHHVIAQARVVVRSLAKELQSEPPVGSDQDRAWTEAGLRLMQHRAALVEAMERIPQPRGGGPNIAPKFGAEVQLPVPPKPRPVPGVGPRPLANPEAWRYEVPTPPRPIALTHRHQLSA